MLKYRECSIVVTDLCNIKCEHCYVSTTKRERAKYLPLHKLKEYVNLLSEGGVEKINLTGGEPFLLFEDIINAIKFISDRGCKPTVITNAFWAKDYKTAELIVSKLSGAGLSEIHLSTDRFHAKHIPVENVLHVCKVAASIGIKAFIFVTKLEGDNFHIYLRQKFGKEYAKKIIEQPLKIKKQELNKFRRKYGIDIKKSYVHNGSCLSVLNSLVDTHGQMFICCTPINTIKKDNLFFVADLNDRKNALRTLKEGSLLGHYLFENGPVSLYRKIFKNTKMATIKASYYCNCDLCFALLCSKRYCNAIADVISKFSPKTPVVWKLQQYPVHER